MSKNKKKFDFKTSNNFLSNYKNEIIKYNQENNALTLKLSDLKTSLELNQSILLDYFSKTIDKSKEIVELVNTTKQLWEENEQLINEKNTLEFKTFKLQETIEDTPTEIREEVSIIQKENLKMKQMLIQKDNSIKKLLRALEKARINSLFKVIREEVLVTDPTTTNLPINNELIHTTQIVNKVSVLNRTIRIKLEKVHKEVKMLQEEYTALRRDRDNKKLERLNIGLTTSSNQRNAKKQLPSNTIGPFHTVNNNIEKPKKVINAFFGYGLNGYSSSSVEDNSSDMSNLDKEPRIVAKNKQKELELLKHEYNNLKNETEKNEKQIDKFKILYKDMKEKMQTINPIIVKTQNQTERRIAIRPSPEGEDAFSR